MSRGHDTGDHPHRRVDRGRFSAPRHADEFADYAVRKAGVTPDDSSFAIEDAAALFANQHLGMEADHPDWDRTIGDLTNWYHDPEDDDY
jgi:hypothetical protein